MGMTQKIAIAADHGGYTLKEDIKNFVFNDLNIEWIDLGAHSEESVDYPEYGFKIAEAIENGQADQGIIICGSGIGISIAANRSPSIRAALCTSKEMAELSRQHNNANVLALGARIISKETAMDCVQAFLTTEFEGGRHERRVAKLGGSQNA
ncbi:MAG: ribose 5-phosphate isomerase B [Alphaproteobacteria bacterium]|nr:MAG: ribose 5-phosphate isomerase B [Alphaproteobacteria bacterium]